VKDDERGYATQARPTRPACHHPERRLTVLTILLIVVLILLLTGGGIGYSRRGRRL
jgi:hypothetical protein